MLFEKRPNILRASLNTAYFPGAFFPFIFLYLFPAFLQYSVISSVFYPVFSLVGHTDPIQLSDLDFTEQVVGQIQ